MHVYMYRYVYKPRRLAYARTPGYFPGDAASAIVRAGRGRAALYVCVCVCVREREREEVVGGREIEVRARVCFKRLPNNAELFRGRTPARSWLLCECVHAVRERVIRPRRHTRVCVIARGY